MVWRMFHEDVENRLSLYSARETFVRLLATGLAVGAPVGWKGCFMNARTDGWINDRMVGQVRE